MFEVDKEKWRLKESFELTGIMVSAQIPDGREEQVDIGLLDRASLLAYLRQEGGVNIFAENLVGVLMGYDRLSSLPEIPDKIAQANDALLVGFYPKYTIFKNQTGEVVSNCILAGMDRDPHALYAALQYAHKTPNALYASDIVDRCEKALTDPDYVKWEEFGLEGKDIEEYEVVLRYWIMRVRASIGD